MLRPTLFFLGCILLLSCELNSKVEPQIENTQSITIERFELDFKNQAIRLDDLKNSYPYLFPAQTPDSIWKAKRNDSLELLLIDAVDSVFGSFEQKRKDINQVFSNYHYYFPKATIPKGITLTTNIDYFSRVVYADSLLLMGLDNFLGQEHPYYQNFPSYLKSSMNPDNLVHAITQELAKAQLASNSKTTFLSKIIHEGKLLYLQERLSPNKSTAKRLGYTDKQFQWAEENEADVWRYFIDQKLLYNTDKELEFRFIALAPFSKFKRSLDTESPGRIGRYIGYRIVSSYMKHNTTTLALLLTEDAVDILKKAKFKPIKS